MKHEKMMHNLETTRRKGEHGGPIRGIIIAVAMSAPFWAAALYWWLS